MKRISAPGRRDMQRAIASPLVQNIVEGMLEIKDKPVLKLIARFLREFDQNPDPSFARKFSALQANETRLPDLQEKATFSPAFGNMLASIEALYNQKHTEVKYQRGAIVELLVGRLVQSRCRVGECYSNSLFHVSSG